MRVLTPCVLMNTKICPLLEHRFPSSFSFSSFHKELPTCFRAQVERFRLRAGVTGYRRPVSLKKKQTFMDKLPVLALSLTGIYTWLRHHFYFCACINFVTKILVLDCYFFRSLCMFVFHITCVLNC